MTPRLSICIPTFNREPYLAQTLESVIDQATDAVQVVVSDNASSDGTESLVARLRERFPGIVYFRWDRNMGADRNYLKSVELASGDYCWFLGSDDVLAPGALRVMLAAIDRSLDIYLASRLECTRDLVPLRTRYWLDPRIGDRAFRLSDRAELLAYLDAAQSLGALFSYLSSICFRRARWTAIAYDDTFTGSLYSHVFMLFSFLEGGCSLGYVREPLVLCRGNNDSFLTSGLVRRVEVDLEGYERLAERFFGDDLEVRRGVHKVMRRSYPWFALTRTRSAAADAAEWHRLETTLHRYGYPPLAVTTARLVGSVRPLVEVAARARRLLRAVRQRETAWPVR